MRGVGGAGAGLGHRHIPRQVRRGLRQAQVAVEEEDEPVAVARGRHRLAVPMTFSYEQKGNKCKNKSCLTRFDHLPHCMDVCS